MPEWRRSTWVLAAVTGVLVIVCALGESHLGRTHAAAALEGQDTVPGAPSALDVNGGLSPKGQEVWELYLRYAGEDRKNERDGDKMSPFVVRVGELGPAAAPAVLEILAPPYRARYTLVGQALTRIGIEHAANCSVELLVAEGTPEDSSDATVALTSLRELHQMIEFLVDAARDESLIRIQQWVAKASAREVLGGMAEHLDPWVSAWARERLKRGEFAWPPWPERNAYNGQAVRDLYRVLSLYEREQGLLPSGWEEDGEVLYQLEPGMGRVPRYPLEYPHSGEFDCLDVGVFDMPFSLLGNGKAVFDSTGSTGLRYGDFDYLNKAIPLDRSAPSFALYAEKKGSSPGGRWVVFSNGAVMWVERDNPHYASPLGKSRAELMAGQERSADLPELDVDTYCLSQRDRQRSLFIYALYAYAKEHGAMPQSPQGGEHALYKLKPYVPDAAAFDSLYMFIENGTAYWDDEQQRVVNADYTCLNKALPWRGVPKDEQVVVIAGEWLGVQPDIREVLFAGDVHFYPIRRGTPHADNPLGRHRRELELW